MIRNKINDLGPLHKITIDGNFTINDNYHGNRAQQPIKINVSMVVSIDGKVNINGKFCATGPSTESNSIDMMKSLSLAPCILVFLNDILFVFCRSSMYWAH